MKILVIYLLIVTLAGCGNKQNAFDKGLKTQSEKKATRADCKGVDFHKNLLEYNNIISTFECLSWATKFPKIFSFLKEIPENEFNNIFMPINKSMFSSTKKRNNFFSITGDYINFKTADEITSTVSQIINNKEIIEGVKLIVSKKLIPNKKTIDTLIKLLQRSEKKNSKERIIISKLLAENPAQKQALKNFLKEVLTLLALKRDKSQYFTSKIFESNQIINSINNLSKDDFVNLIYYPIKRKSIIQSSARLKEIILNNEYACQEYQGVYVLKQDVELVERMNQLKTQTHEEFLNSIFDLRIKFVLYNNICPYPELNNLVSTFLDDLVDFGTQKAGFEILQKVTRGLGENRYALFDYLGSSFFDLYREMLETDKESRIFEEIYPFTNSIDEQTFNFAKNTFELIFKDQEFTNNLNTFWLESSDDDKNLLVSSMTELALIPNSNENILNYATEIQQSFEGPSIKVMENAEGIVSLLERFQTYSKDKGFNEEIVDLFSLSNLFKIFDLLNSNSKINLDNDEDVLGENSEENVLVQSSLVKEIPIQPSESKSLKCLEEFHEALVGEYDFWEVLDMFPRSCLELEEEDKEISNKIFEWTYSIDEAYAVATGGKRFSVSYGVISGEMMRYFHGLIHLVNKHLDKNDSNYISKIVDLVNEHLYKLGLLTAIESSADLLNQVILRDKRLVDNTLLKIVESSPDELNANILLLLGILEKKSDGLTKYRYNQEYLSTEVGEKGTWDETEALSFYKEAKKFLFKENNKSGNLLYHLISLLHPEKDFLIPYNSNKAKPYFLKPNKFVSFLFDVSSPDTLEKVRYETENEIIEKELNLISRLEIVIREISFLDNFYGAFFINKVASAEKYTKDVMTLKKNVTLLEKTGGLFRKFNFFPKETKWAFKNIGSSYDSLWQLNAGSMEHGELIQSVLTMAVLSSDKKSQKFIPYRKPKVSLVKDHNGKFITLLTKNSVLTHIAGFLRNNYTKKEIIENPRFNVFNENFLKSISFTALYKSLDIILKHKNNELIFKDFYSYLNSSEDLDREFGIVLEFVELITSTYKNQELDFLPAVLPIILDNYKLFKTSFFTKMKKENLDAVFTILSKLNKLDPKDREKLMLFLSQTLKENGDVTTIATFLDERFLNSLSNFLVSLDFYSKKSEQTITEKSSMFLESLIADSLFTSTEVHELFSQVYRKEKGFEYFYGILKTLTAEQQGMTGVKRGVDEIFLKNDASLKKFLLEIFARFEVQ